MTSVEGLRVVVTGGSRGLALGIVEALVDRKAIVTVVARQQAPLADVARRFGVATISGDMTEADLADRSRTPDRIVREDRTDRCGRDRWDRCMARERQSGGNCVSMHSARALAGPLPPTGSGSPRSPAPLQPARRPRAQRP